MEVLDTVWAHGALWVLSQAELGHEPRFQLASRLRHPSASGPLDSQTPGLPQLYQLCDPLVGAADPPRTVPCPSTAATAFSHLSLPWDIVNNSRPHLSLSPCPVQDLQDRTIKRTGRAAHPTKASENHSESIMLSLAR